MTLRFNIETPRALAFVETSLLSLPSRPYSYFLITGYCTLIMERRLAGSTAYVPHFSDLTIGGAAS